MVPNLNEIDAPAQTLEQQLSMLSAESGWRSSEPFGVRPGIMRRTMAANGRYMDYVRVDDDFRILFVNGLFGIRTDKVLGEGWLKIHVRGDGEGAFLFGERRRVDIPQRYCTYRYQPRGFDETHWYGDHDATRWLTIYVKPDYLGDRLGIEPNVLPVELQPVTKGYNADPAFGMRPAEPEALRILTNLAETGTPSALRHLELESRAFDLIAMLLRASGGADSFTLSSRDRGRIVEAREILDESLADVPLVPVLARRVGLNRTKLRAGFKQMFGQTIVDYCRNRRLDVAWRRILDREASIAEIAYDVGYDSAANFATAFRRRYGVSPSELRKPSA